MIRIPALILTILLAACSSKTLPRVRDLPRETINGSPDYSQKSFWAAHPWKKDPSDSLPEDLSGEEKDSLADVFFIHPTTYTGSRTTWNADLLDSILVQKTDYSSILYQASAFNRYSRVFAPRYRQAHLSAFFENSDSARAAFDTAYADVRAAFLEYLSNYHNQRPLIIAGHSQGGRMAIRLLREFFDGKPLQSSLVAAYIIGWPVTKNDFQNIPVCSDSLQTGCFCSWRTFRKDYLPEYHVLEKDTALVTNPLSWKTDDAYVSREWNRGSVLRDFSEVVYETTDAQVANGVLWVNRPRFPGSVFLTTRNYHIADINLFYVNLRENTGQRIRSFLTGKK